jgi:hypothetical protein
MAPATPDLRNVLDWVWPLIVEESEEADLGDPANWSLGYKFLAALLFGLALPTCALFLYCMACVVWVNLPHWSSFIIGAIGFAVVWLTATVILFFALAHM